MDDALEEEVRRLWGGESVPPRSEPDDATPEMIRIIAAAAASTNDQVRRLDALTLPLGQINTYAGRSDAEITAERFLDQVRSDYRRVSPDLPLREAEQWRHSPEGIAALNEAHVSNESVGVLAVGELLDLNLSIRRLYGWMHRDNLDMKAFTSTFGEVLGPVVRATLLPPPTRLPVWGPDLESEAGQLWTQAFVLAGARRLRIAVRPSRKRRPKAATERTRVR
ncbi:hypothetical protein [Mycolicibacterium mageritense]|uniref:hypothetical protein n=1 Tax=Mycolicibacterium mageritense TaxID=53462 RepID=UPI001E3545B4|nr:hypothetical protein [Mycolicibacterium mageritense]GJJ23760.1 hypothetical protein MTY414_74340 [Mycolicibacterium mageritense]